MLLRFVFTFVTFWLSLSSAVNAMEPTTVVVNPIPNLLNDVGQKPAPYNHLLDQFDDLTVVFVPATRMLGQFNMPDVNCLFPGNMDTMPAKQTLIQSEPVKKTNAYLFSWSENIQDISDAGVIALRRGFIYGGIREKINTNYVDLSTARETLTFLTLSRVDAIIGYLPDIQAAAIEENVPMPFYDSDKPIYSSSHRFICHDSEHNRRFVERANERIAEFIRQEN